MTDQIFYYIGMRGAYQALSAPQSWFQEICVPSVKEYTFSGHMCSFKRETSDKMAQTQSRPCTWQIHEQQN